MRANARFLLFFLSLSAFALALSSGPPAAFADDKKVLSRARAQFQTGIELEQAGNWAAALEQFREVGQVRMTPQLRFHIALCEENLGRLVAALGGYELALAEADSVGPDFRSEVEANVAKLRARIPKLVIARGQGAEAASIALDGVTLGASSIGVEVPIDPGPHTIAAKAPGHKPFSATVSVNEEETNTVTVTLEALPSDQVDVGGGTAQAGFGTGPADKPPSRLVPYVVGGAGAAFLVASGVLFVLREGALGDLQDKCVDGRCPKSEQDTYDSMVFYHYGAQVTLGVGIAAVGTAVTLILLEKKKPRPTQASLALSPGTAHGLAGATLSGAF